MVIIYLVAIVLANLTVSWFGPSMVIVNAFVFIGLDLTSRDKLHEAWKNDHLIIRMGLLIATGSLISWALNSGAGQIALASFLSFAVSAIVDSLAFHRLGRYSRFIRVNGSNLFSALTDSMLFPTLAFGAFLPLVILGQFAAKIVGGWIWYLILNKHETIRMQP